MNFSTVVLLTAGVLSMNFPMQWGARLKLGSNIIALGDSYTIGSGASSDFHRWVGRLQTSLGGPIAVNAVSGSGMSQQARSAFAAIPLRNGSLITVMAGFNDIRRNGPASYNKIGTNLRSVIATALLSTAIPPNWVYFCRRSAGWTEVGGGQQGKAIVAGVAGGSGLYTTGNDEWIECDFNGETLVVGAWTSVAGSAGNRDFEVWVDDVYQETFYANGATEETAVGTNHNALVLTHLGVGKHVAKLKTINGAPGVKTIVDYFGTLAAPTSVAPVLVAEIPNMTNWTYNGYTTSQAEVDDANGIIRDVVAEFDGWPVRVVPISEWYQASPAWTTADQHPNDSGHMLIWAAFMGQLELTRL